MADQLDMFAPADRSAIIDPTGTYRYLLTRKLTPSPGTALWIMLNPSTADATRDDPTIRKICGFTKSWELGAIEVVNCFALRSTDPKALKGHPDPVGPENDEHIRQAVRRADAIVCAWGNHGALNDRDIAVRKLLAEANRVPVVLGLNTGGQRPQPVHPLYQKLSLVPLVWAP